VRKDYIPVSNRTAAASDETAFVERYWADVKRHDAAPDVSALARRDEYRIIRPYLARLAKGSRVLDGGRGRGEWTVFLSPGRIGTKAPDTSSRACTTNWSSAAS
jgi:hypothetical protein